MPDDVSGRTPWDLLAEHGRAAFLASVLVLFGLGYFVHDAAAPGEPVVFGFVEYTKSTEKPELNDWFVYGAFASLVFGIILAAFAGSSPTLVHENFLMRNRLRRLERANDSLKNAKWLGDYHRKLAEDLEVKRDRFARNAQWLHNKIKEGSKLESHQWGETPNKIGALGEQIIVMAASRMSTGDIYEQTDADNSSIKWSLGLLTDLDYIEEDTRLRKDVSPVFKVMEHYFFLREKGKERYRELCKQGKVAEPLEEYSK